MQSCIRGGNHEDQNNDGWGKVLHAMHPFRMSLRTFQRLTASSDLLAIDRMSNHSGANIEKSSLRCAWRGHRSEGRPRVYSRCSRPWFSPVDYLDVGCRREITIDPNKYRQDYAVLVSRLAFCPVRAHKVEVDRRPEDLALRRSDLRRADTPLS
jgi:hypothetical protein